MWDPKPDLPPSFCYCTDFCRSCVFCDLYGSANAANALVCAMCRLFPDGDPIHVNLDALIPEGQHSPSSLDKGVTARPAADAQPQTSPGPEVLQALPNAAVYSRLLAVIKPYAEDQQKWDVWAEEEDRSMTDKDAQVLHQSILCFCMDVGGPIAADLYAWAQQCRPQKWLCTINFALP